MQIDKISSQQQTANIAQMKNAYGESAEKVENDNDRDDRMKVSANANKQMGIGNAVDVLA